MKGGNRAEEIYLSEEDERILDKVYANGRMAYPRGIDYHHPMSGHLIEKYGREHAIQILANPANRTPEGGAAPQIQF